MPLPILTIPTTTEQREARARDERPSRRAFRGDTIQLPFAIIDQETGGAIDITGWAFRWTAKYALANPDAQAALQQDTLAIGGIVLVSPTEGQLVVTVQPIATRSWPDADVRVLYDLQATDLGGIVTTCEMGDLTIEPDCTRTI